MRIIGAALGTIMAIIITAHMAHMRSPWAEVPDLHPHHGAGARRHVTAHVEGHVDEVKPSEGGRDHEAGQHHQPVASRDGLDHGCDVRTPNRTWL